MTTLANMPRLQAVMAVRAQTVNSLFSLSALATLQTKATIVNSNICSFNSLFCGRREIQIHFEAPVFATDEKRSRKMIRTFSHDKRNRQPFHILASKEYVFQIKTFIC